MRDGDEYVVNGQKIWTSFAHFARFGILIARTDPEAPKHQGISYFVCPMDLPGIEIRPIVEMTGAHKFNEVFFDDVRIPAENLVGDENGGWALAKVTLGNERVSLSEGGALWGHGPVRRRPARRWSARRRRRPTRRCASGWRALHIESEMLRLIRLRTVTAARQGRAARPRGVDPQGAGRRARPEDHGAGQGPAGAAGMLPTAGPLGAADGLVALRVPLLPRAHGRRRHGRGAAQHHRRAGARPARTTRSAQSGR